MMVKDNKTIREEYFKARGLEMPPFDQKGRLEQAIQYTRIVPPDYEAVLMLFDPEEDQNHPGWVNQMGYIFNAHLGNAYFDAEKAHQFKIQGAKLNDANSLFNLAAKFFNGEETEINPELALQYYIAAHDEGNYRAGAWIYEIARLYDNRLFSPQHKEYTGQILDYLSASSDRGSFEAAHALSGLCATGKGYSKNVDATIKEYEWALSKKNAAPAEEHARCRMVWQFALRTYLGLGVDESLERTLDILNSFPEKSNDPYARQIIKKDAYLLKDIIERERQQPEVYRSVKEFLKKCYDEGIHPSKINVNGGSEDKVDIFWCITKLAHGEKWDTWNEWRKVLETAQASRMGMSIESVIASTGFAGPRYNPVDEKGLPVLGVWEKPSTSQEEAERILLGKGAYVPEAGVVKLKGLVCDASTGTIMFDYIKASDSPALLVPEDFEVALVLAYGHPEKIITPSLSLESPSRCGFDDKYDVFEYKLWGPAWLGYTDFGRTLFKTDQLIGAICWSPHEFQIGSLDQTFHQSVPAFALQLTEDIMFTGGRDGGVARRVMLKPEHIALPSTKDQSGNISILIAEVKMRVDGSYIVNKGEDGENRLLALNDDMYQQGRTVNKLTDRYNDIASLMPVFARAQELMALAHSVAEARRLGFKLNPSIQDKISKRYRQYEEAPPLPMHELLCVDIPMKYERF